MMPSLNKEQGLWKKGYRRVVGLDEAGRGPLAGPVVAAAVCLKQRLASDRRRLLTVGIKDSKQLPPHRREELYTFITKHPAIKWGIGRVSERVIDKINIKNAAELAMERALKNLEKKIKKQADFLIIDGNHIRNSKLANYNLKLLIKADEKVFSCSAASILAKVTRDRIMQGYHKKYPRYNFEKHKGYPTKPHLKMLKKYGPSKIHRKTFRPVKGFAF